MKEDQKQIRQPEETPEEGINESFQTGNIEFPPRNKKQHKSDRHQNPESD
ncbi:hypothetical protein GCM10007216_25650 [Thalassobacillus devorans]|uniref:Uncharacterized protein n=1 Tax=Thalassobacillus devorans TaxID=279813 RepID=A0ABQ1PB78_9BACI|nr:hypothetical protein [Thalassobacillus devorans]NIK29906.1 hypothetical protein [Thalassobacillus devorans]GGC93775.1 hypothetical protein GCM10007216_25650 [Thalassobacillus devorans]